MPNVDRNAGANHPRNQRFQGQQDRMPPRQKPGFITAPDPRMPAMTSQIKVTNRAAKGALKGKPTFLAYNQYLYPEDVNPLDESTWIKPGESVLIDKEVIVGNFGFIFAPDEKTGKIYGEVGRESVINRFGQWQYEATPREQCTQKGMSYSNTIIGPPPYLADLLLVQVDSRGKEVGKTVSIYEEVVRNQVFHDDKTKIITATK